MSVTNSLDAINAKLAKAVGYVDKIDTKTSSISKGSKGFSAALNGLFGGTGGVGQGSGGNIISSAIPKVSVPAPSNRGTTAAQPAGPTGPGSPSSGGSKGGGNGNILAGALGSFGAVASAAWQMTPGVRDYAASQASLFPVAFSMQGGYSNARAAGAIREGIGQGSSGIYDAKAAAAMGTNAGLSFNVKGAGGGTSLGNALGAASFAYQMTGMSNQAAMQGQISMVKGTSGVSSTLARIGIFTTDMNSGKPKDMGQIVDELWARFYGSKSAKISMEQFEADLLMGFLGSDLNTMFGEGSPLYQQVVSFMRVKVKANGRAGMRVSQKSGANNVAQVAKTLGMTALNTPTVKAGEVASARNAQIDVGSASGMQGYVTAQDAIVNLNEGMTDLYETLGPLAEGFTTLKTYLDTFTSSGEGAGLLGGVTGLVKALSPAGMLGLASGGTSTSDSINARLSAGEYVINARAAQQIGRGNLDRLNSSGHAFGSAYASPARQFQRGGEVSGQDLVNYATQQEFLDTPYVDHTKIPEWGPGKGWDCSSFTSYVFKNFGIQLPALSDSQYSMGTAVAREDLQPGDLVFFHNSSSGTKTTGHVGIYIGDGKMVNAASPSSGTRIEDVTWDTYVGARRMSGLQPGTATANAASTLATSDPGNPASSNIKTSALGAASSMNAKYTSVMATSLAGMGKAGASVGSFTAGYVDASSVGNNVRALSSQLGTAAAGADVPGGSGPAASAAAAAPGGAGGSTSGAAPPSGKLSDWLVAAGFTGEDLREAWAIAMRESGGNPTSVRAGADYGLFQFNKPTWGKQSWWDDKKLLDPMYNAKMAYKLSNGGKNWYSWGLTGDGRVNAGAYRNSGWSEERIQSDIWEPYKKYYDQYAEGASQGMASTHAGVVNVHEGEMIVPASQAQDFREALRDVLSGSGRGSAQKVEINLHIERTSHEEAVRFAREVKVLLEADARSERMGSR